MSERADPPVLRIGTRDRSPQAREAARVRKAEREARIIGLLNDGVSMRAIAAREDVSINRMRKVVRAILERRAPKPPMEYLAREINRLHEALPVAFDSMMDPTSAPNFRAIGSLVKIVRELDHCHGFFPNQARSRRQPRRPPAPSPLARDGTDDDWPDEVAATD